MDTAQSQMYVLPNVHFTPVNLNGVAGEIGVPNDIKGEGIVFYIHGGGMICGTAETSRGFASMIANESGLKTYTITYRLAPEHPYPAAVEDTYQAFLAIQKNHPGQPIALVGESGGAYLTLTTTLKAKMMKTPLPTVIVPYSAPIDFDMILDRSLHKAVDATVTAEGLVILRSLYSPNSNGTDPLNSPILGNYTDFPPMYVTWNNQETLAQDSEKLVEIALQAGVEVLAKGYDDCFHAFQIIGYGTPESHEVLRNTVEFIQKHF